MRVIPAGTNVGLRVVRVRVKPAGTRKKKPLPITNLIYYSILIKPFAIKDPKPSLQLVVGGSECLDLVFDFENQLELEQRRGEVNLSVFANTCMSA